MARELERRGLSVTWYADDILGWNERVAHRYGILVINRPRGTTRAIFKYLGLLLRRRPRHVEIYFGSKTSLRLAYVVGAWALRIPVVLVCRGGEVFYWQAHTRARKLADRICFAMAKAVVYPELWIPAALLRLKATTEKKLVFVANATEVRDGVSLKRDGKVVLFLNTFRSWRRADLIVEAAPLVLKQFPDAQFLLVGAGGDRLEEYAPNEHKVRGLVDQLGVGNNVRILPLTDDPWSYYERASVYVLPADRVFSNFGLLEAMERSLPPVVADVPGAELVVAHGVNGLRVPQTPQALADAITQLLSNEQERQRMGAAARQTILEKYSTEKGAEALLTFYRSRLWR